MLADLGVGARPAGKVKGGLREGVDPLRCGLRAQATAVERAQHRQRRRQQVEVVVPRHDVERRPHERGLDHAPLLECAVQRGRVERGQARPQREVRRRGLLGLQAADPLDRGDRSDSGSFEKELPGERGAIEPVPGKDLVLRSAHRYGPVGPAAADSSPARNVAMSRV